MKVIWVLFSAVPSFSNAFVKDDVDAEAVKAHDQCLLQVAQSKGRELVHEQASKKFLDGEHGWRLQFSNESSTDKVLVEIYYQFKCPHCVEVLSTDLRQAWEDVDLRSMMDVRLYPEYFPMRCCLDGDERCFGSHEGENGCLGSRVELCAMDILNDSSKSVPLVICMASHGNKASAEDSSQDCAMQLGIGMDEITACVNSQRGLDLMVSVYNKSAQVNSDHIPWVLVNGKHAENDALIPAVCKVLQNPKPNVCLSSQGDQEKQLHKKKPKKAGCSKKDPCFFVDSDNSDFEAHKLAW